MYKTTFVLAVIALAGANIIKVPVQRYNIETSPGNVPLGNAPLSRHTSTGISGNVTVAGEVFMMLFDTKAGNMWLTSPSCVECQVPKYFYASSASTNSYSVNTTLYFGGLTLIGPTPSNFVSLGNSGPFTQSFVRVVSVQNGYLRSNKCDGVFGLGFANSSTSNVAPPITTMWSYSLIAEEVFSLYLTRNSSNGGFLILGGADSSLYKGPLTYVSLVNTALWQFKLNFVSVSGFSFCNNCEATVDTTTHLIGMPQSSFEWLAALLGANAVYNGQIVFDCANVSQLPSVAFVIGGTLFNMNPSDYLINMAGQDGNTYCAAAFTAIDSENIILGNKFIEKYYTVFDMSALKIGFAPAVHY